MNRIILWFRRDLRLQDHRPLFEACKHSKEVFPVFVFDTQILGQLKDKSDRRVHFLYSCIKELKAELVRRGSDLIVGHGDPVEVIPKLAQRYRATHVFAGRDYEPHAKSRDRKVELQLKKQKVDFTQIKDHVIWEGMEILNQKGEPYRVFTPYKKAWLKKTRLADLESADPNLSSLARLKEPLPSLENLGFRVPPAVSSAPEPGRTGAMRALKSFRPKTADYHLKRDFPSRDGTSHLSPHLRFGTVSIRECLRLSTESKSLGHSTWTSELIWREFYQMILDRFPEVAKTSFRPEYRNLKWPGPTSHFNAWKEGKTGFPIIDAAMRKLARTGEMHNRLRMITASFLVKDLLIDWRKGEAHFASLLLDFDLAANNGGWQWCASTGCDAQPYFRIFNPIAQSRKFDPDGLFIRQNLPELAKFPTRWIHEPWMSDVKIQKAAQCIVGRDYPHPIIHHATQRNAALRLFKKSKLV